MAGDASLQPTEYFVESIREDSIGLFVSFVKHKDRFGHVISLVRGDDLTPVFVSKEGNDEEEWPDSPPLQEIHLEDRNDLTVAMLVGKAGDGHWSVAVEPSLTPSELQFSVACRMQDYPRQICSRYGCLLDDRIQPVFEPGGPWVWKIGEVSLCADVIPTGEYPTPEIPADEHGVEINASLDVEPFPKTIQWQYKFWIRD